MLSQRIALTIFDALRISEKKNLSQFLTKSLEKTLLGGRLPLRQKKLEPEAHFEPPDKKNKKQSELDH